MRTSFILLAIAFALLTGGRAQERVLHVMSWNVENLFDTVHDEGFRDEEFLPQGTHRWTSHRYWRKQTDVARVVAAVADSCGVPDLIGLCEVENDSVLTMLTRRSPLRNLGYSYVMSHCADARGIDVALLFQPSSFRLASSHSIRVPSRERGLRATRDILHVKGLVATSAGIDTLHVLVVHLPSRAGGRSGDKNRRLAAQTLWNAVDSIAASLPSSSAPRILVMGDFNAGPRDRIFRRAPLRLTDDPSVPGTYAFRGYWQWIDHIMVSASVPCSGPARPVAFPWQLEPNEGFGGEMPRRTFRGPNYHGGVSDHLPVVLEVLL